MEIKLNEEDFVLISKAFFAEIETKVDQKFFVLLLVRHRNQGLLGLLFGLAAYGAVLPARWLALGSRNLQATGACRHPLIKEFRVDAIALPSRNS